MDFQTTVMSHWDFSPGKLGMFFPGESQLRHSRATEPTVCAECFSVSIIHQTDMDYMVFSVRTDVNACDRTRGCTDTVRESALKVASGRKNHLSHRGIARTSVVCLSDAIPTELHPYPFCWSLPAHHDQVTAHISNVSVSHSALYISFTCYNTQNCAHSVPGKVLVRTGKQKS